jgi:uncharacterized glyoxalase superfamily protein PhnB
MTQNTPTENTATENTATENTATENTATKQPPAPNVWPAFRANDARGLIKFLVEALGFEEVVVYGEAGRVDHAELAWPPGGGVMLGSVKAGSARDDAGQSGVTGPGHFSAYVVTSNPDGLYARAVAHGAKVASELHDTDYGSRDFAIEDPEGNRWSFGTYPGHPR